MVELIKTASELLGLHKWPELRGVYTFNLSVLTITPAIALYGLLYVPLRHETKLAAIGCFLFSMLGITAGYHRLWSHRAYKASYLLQVFLIVAGASAVQGSCYWWARRHRSHHRYTDTDRDPYNSQRGLLWTHIGWMLFKTDIRSGAADISDLQKDPLVQWQHNWYFLIQFVVGYLLPTVLPGLLWGDWWGGLCYVCAARMTLCHHSVFCINSIAHYLGDAPYDDKHTPRDNLISAIFTSGEGYHNYHHQFPMDYRNAVRWYQYDPTKWFIASCAFFGLANNLRRFPKNEIEKSALTMKLKNLKRVQDSLVWPKKVEELPVVNWETFQENSKEAVLILVSGFIHDVSDFVDEHPGGAKLLTANTGKDMTSAFFGGVYDHSNAAHNFLAMKRVGILSGGVEYLGEGHGEQPDVHLVPPAQRLYIAKTGGEALPNKAQNGLQAQ